MSFAPAVPRFPGPKRPWSAFLETSSVASSIVFAAPASFEDYWIEQIDVVELFSGGSTSSFNMYFLATAVGGAPTKYFFGNQVSPSTGLYFPYRGLLRVDADLYFQNVSGTWAVYVSGFATATINQVV